MKWWHIGLSTRGRETLFPQEDMLREAVRRLADAAPDQTLLHGIVDDHLHHIVAAERAGAGRIAHRLCLSLAPVAGCRFQPSFLEEVRGRAHLLRLVRYVLTQPRHHELAVHPALWIGSCFQDIVGARWLPRFRLQLSLHLPRLRLRDLLEIVGLPARPVAPCSVEGIRRLGVVALAEAASAAMLAPPNPVGRSTQTLLARQVAVQMALSAGFFPKEISRALDWAPRTIRRYGHATVPSEATRAVAMRLTLIEAVNDSQNKIDQTGGTACPPRR